MTTSDPYSTGYGTPPAYGAPSTWSGAPYGSPAPYGGGPGPVGQVRSTGLAMLLFFVTFGVYGWYWYFVTHEEMKRHSGTGLGGGIALLLAVFVGFASPFLSSSEVGDLYRRRGQQPPVSAATGCWVFPGIFLLVLPIVWFVRTNGALNAYWRSCGAR